MLMKKFYFILPIFILSCWFSFAQQATTPNGKWNSVPPESLSLIQPKLHTELPRPDAKDLIITHTGYTLSFNTTYHVANWVAYELTAERKLFPLLNAVIISFLTPC